MTPNAIAELPVANGAVPSVPSPPTTIEETGLHPDTLSQLLLKTLVAGEASGTGLSEKLRVAYSVLTVGYLVSRGLAKSGSRDFYDDDRGTDHGVRNDGRVDQIATWAVTTFMS